MSIYDQAVYREGHEGYIAVGYESGMKAPHVTDLGSAPSLSAIGYAQEPTIRRARNPQAVHAAGSYRPVGFKQGRIESTISGQFILGGAAGAKKFLQSAFRSSSTSAIPNENRFMCKPVLALGGGAASNCDTARGFLYLARMAMLSSLKINGTMDGLVTCDYEATAITIVESTAPTALTESQILTAGGTPYTLNEVTFTTENGTELSPVVESFGLSQTDTIRARGFHAPGDGAVAYAPRQLTAGSENITLELGLNDRLPTAPATLSIVLNNGTETITIAIGGLQLSEDSLTGVDTENPFAFSANLMATQVTIS